MEREKRTEKSLATVKRNAQSEKFGGRKKSVILSLELDGLPPTVNHLYRNYRGRRYKTAAGRKYQEQVTKKLRDEWSGNPACEEAVELCITFTTSSRRRWDIDNRVKALQDCLSLAGVIKDDRQVEILHVERKTRHISR